MGRDHGTTDRIRLRAYELWEIEGRVHGRDVTHWLQAEQELVSPGALISANDADSSARKRRVRSNAPASKSNPTKRATGRPKSRKPVEETS